MPEVPTDTGGGARASSKSTAAAKAGEYDLPSMTVKQLKAFLRSKDVEIPDGAQRDQLLELSEASKHLPTVTWARTKTPDGRYYWFNLKTKETCWTKPVDA